MNEMNKYIATPMMKPPKLGKVVPTKSREKLSKKLTPISAINKRPFGFLSGSCFAAIMPTVKERITIIAITISEDTNSPAILILKKLLKMLVFSSGIFILSYMRDKG